MANSNFIKADRGEVTSASEAGNKMLVLSWGNFSCVSVIWSCVARFSFLKTSKWIRFSTETEGSLSLQVSSLG